MNSKSRIQQLLDTVHFWKTHYSAYVKRKKSIDKYIKTHKIKKLQVGCGAFIINSWLNSDLYGNERVVPLDLKKKFPISDDLFDYIFSEQVIEHFTFDEGERIFREMFRVLKPNGKIRIATPNLQFLINLYNTPDKTLQKKYIKAFSDVEFKNSKLYSHVFVINAFFREWGHQFIYDFKTLNNLLKEIGFVNIKEYKSGESKDRNLKNLELHWKILGKDFYNLETMIIEAEKPNIK